MAPFRSANTQSLFVAGQLVAKFTHGYFVVRERQEGVPTASSVKVYAADGSFIRRAVPQFEGAARVVLLDAMAEPNGDVLVSGYAEPKDGAIAYMIARIDGAGNTTEVIRTNPFVPHLICSGKDGTVWSFGLVLKNENDRALPNYSMLRQYSFKQGMLNAVLDRSSFPKNVSPPTKGTPGGAWLECNGRRVGVYTGATNEWIEFDPASKQMQRWQTTPLLKARVTGLTFTSTGQVYASFDRWESGVGARGLFQLQPGGDGTANWAAIQQTVHVGSEPDTFVMLYGSQGDELVHTRSGRPGMMFWSRVTRAH